MWTRSADDQWVIKASGTLSDGSPGGNIIGALFKNISLGTLWNSVAGILGGGLGGQLLGLLGLGGVGAAAADAAGTGLDLMTIIQQIAGGGVGGGVLMVIVGLIKQAMAGGARKD